MVFFYFFKFFTLGSTFIKTNLFFLLGFNFYGFLNTTNPPYDTHFRLFAHRSAYLKRFLLNSSYMSKYAKAPKIQ